jgi:hypothetical protein
MRTKMEEVFIGVPTAVTLGDVANVLRRSWTLDDTMSEPHVVLALGSRAYVTELDRTDVESDPLHFEDPSKPVKLRAAIGDDYRLLSLRFTDPALARDMTRALAKSELAEQPMLLDADGIFLNPGEFLARLDEQPPWNWFTSRRLFRPGAKA